VGHKQFYAGINGLREPIGNMVLVVRGWQL